MHFTNNFLDVTSSILPFNTWYFFTSFSNMYYYTSAPIDMMTGVNDACRRMLKHKSYLLYYNYYFFKLFYLVDGSYTVICRES